MIRMGQKNLVKGIDCFAGQFRQLAVLGHQLIGGQHPWAAGIGEDREPGPLGRGYLASTSAMIGLVSATSRAAERNAHALAMDSM